MYLKKLEIRGFKSFAENTEIFFKPGINIVVGPNGCGKSNIMDAVRWVLGESNIRSLRGQTYEDVIFNGTDSKKALGLAAVEMTIDNSCHSLPVEYNEVTVGRKVYRSGDSEFNLNKSKVRLKDITGLFTGTGLGKKGYSIIGQGELEQVLNAQGFDRRLILEEASGIIKYRQQRDEVSHRIIATSNDLIRMNDILTELENRKNELQIKADKANRYLTLSHQYTELEKKLLEYDLDKVRKDLGEKVRVLAVKQESVDLMRQEIEKQEIDLKTAEQQANKATTVVNDCKEKKFAIENHFNSLQADLVLYKEKIKNCNERIRSAASDEAKYTPLLEKLQQDLEIAIQDYQTEKQNYSHRHNEIHLLTADLNNLKANIEECLSNFEKSKGMVFDQINQESMLKNQIGQKEQGINRIREKQERLKIHIDESAHKIKAAKEKLKGLKECYRETSDKLGVAEKEVKDLETQQAEIKTVRQKLEQDYKKLHRDSIMLDNQLSALRDMEKSHTGYSEAVRVLLRHWEKGNHDLIGILGVMGDLIDVPAGMELAIDVAVGKGLENIVVEQAGQAHRAITFLKNNNIGRITFLPLDILKAQPVPIKILHKINSFKGVLGIAANLIDFEAKYHKAVEYLLGRVLIVDNLDNGLEVYRNIQYPLRIVTREGEVINVSGAMSGGVKPNRQNSPLQRKNQEKKLKLTAEQNHLGIEQIAQKMEHSNQVIQRLESLAVSARSNLMEYQFQNEMMMKEIEKINTEVELDTEKRNTNLADLNIFDEQIKILQKDIEIEQEKYAIIKQKNLQFTDELEKTKKDIELKKRDYDIGNERLASLSYQLQMKKKELDNVDKNIDQFNRVKRSYQESLEETKTLKQMMKEKIVVLETKIAGLNSEISNGRLELDKVIRIIEHAIENEKQYNENTKRLRLAISPQKNELMELESGTRNLEIQAARLETELDGMNNRWRERFNCELPANIDLTLSNREIREYKRNIIDLQTRRDQIGPVDVESIQEYEEIKTRYEFMHSQYIDMLTAKQSLENLLQETENIMVKNFSHFMLLANESFKLTFNQIFGGGEANLRLESDENKFAAGIDIIVKMPGKKHQPLNLLSGGERALTCIAFIFSLLRLRPAPFCLLDEIDAALDEVNLLRFINFLKEMAADIQFVIITHRQVTIEAGDNVFGVTMPEEGISTVLSITYSEAESLAG